MSNHTTDPMLSIDDRARDPLLKAMLSAGDLFGGMLSEPSTPRPPLSEHPTRGICLSCKQPFPNAWFAFVGGWAVHRRCDSCAATIKPRIGPQPIKQHNPQRNDRTEPKAA